MRPASLVCAQFLGGAVCVPGNDRVGDIENVLCAAIVLFEEDDIGGVGSRGESEEHCDNRRRAKAVDGLVLVADDEEIASLPSGGPMKCDASSYWAVFVS